MRHITSLLIILTMLFASVSTNASTLPAKKKVTTVIEYTAADKLKFEQKTKELFDRNITSHKFDKRSNKGVITFKGELKTIKSKAFYGKDISSITLPKSVTIIEGYAFSLCQNLESITLPQNLITLGEYAFSECERLRQVTMNDGLVNVGNSAFYNCRNLTAIDLPSSVVKIASNAFDNCPHITTLSIGTTISQIPNIHAMLPNLTTIDIKEGVTEIVGGTFHKCGKLQSISIPSSVTTIDNAAFKECAGRLIINSRHLIERDYEKENIPSSTWLQGSTFDEIILGDNIRRVGDLAFARYSTLSNIVLGSNTSSIGSGAFTVCGKLTAINIPESVTMIESGAFSGCFELQHFSGKYATEDGRALVIGSTIIAYANASGEEYLTPEGVTSIGWGSFCGCTSLKSLIIREGVTEIGASAFYLCQNLYYINIPRDVTTIGEQAFKGCVSLTNINFPRSITSIGNGAFDGCNNLKIVEFDDLSTGIYTKVAGLCPQIMSITLSDEITTIPDGCFNHFNNLRYITLGQGITSFNTGAIAGCKNIKKIKLSASTTEIVFDDSIDVLWDAQYQHEDEGVYPDEDINDASSPFNTGIFEGGENIESIVLGKNIWGVYYNAINKMTGDKFSKITIYKGLRWYNNLFPQSVYTESINTVFEIDGYWDCESGTIGGCPHHLFARSDIYTLDGKLKYKANPKAIAIPKGVTKIGNYIFSGCTELKGVTIPSSVTEIGEGAFDGCAKLSSIVIPKSVTRIERAAFAHCDNLQSITLSSGVTKIEDSTFYCCKKLSSIKIPKSVTKISSHAFYGCESLQSITIPSSVYEVGSYAFGGCIKLKSVTLSSRYTSIGDDAFCGKIYDSSHLPMSSITSYNVAGVYIGKTAINGRVVETPLQLFDDGTYLKTRIDGGSETLHEVGTYSISGSTIILKVVGNTIDSKYVVRRVSGSESIAVNKTTGVLGKYGKKLMTWDSSNEYWRVTYSSSNNSTYTYTSDNLYNNKRVANSIVNKLKDNMSVNIY